MPKKNLEEAYFIMNLLSSTKPILGPIKLWNQVLFTNIFKALL